jgi:hypothetical protein
MDISIPMAKVLMTLSALAYIEDDAPTKHTPPPNINTVKSALTHALKKPEFETKGQWHLKWGPIQYNPSRNLAYVVQKQNTQTYAIVLRGTVGSFSSFREDIPTSQVSFGYGLPDKAKVSSEFDAALKGMLATPDPKTGTLLADYLSSTALTSGALDLYVTGHSQGGGLAPMMTAWAHHARNSWAGGPHKITNYTFAAPSSGNPAFAGWIENNTNTFMVRNPLDIVPHGYATPQKLVTDGIPSRVPLGWAVVIEAAAALSFVTGPWAQPKTRYELRQKRMNGTYLEQVEGQHNHNSYLYLLGAKQTHVGDKSPLSKPYHPAPSSSSSPFR